MKFDICTLLRIVHMCVLRECFLSDGERRVSEAASRRPALRYVRQEQRRGDSPGDAQLSRDCGLLHTGGNGRLSVFLIYNDMLARPSTPVSF